MTQSSDQQPVLGHRTIRSPHREPLDRAAALRLDGIGAHSLAEPHFARALAAVRCDPACDESDLLDALNDLARCRFNGGRYEQALQDYVCMQALMQAEDHAAAASLLWVLHQIQSCRKALRDRAGIAVLQGGVDALLRRSRTQAMANETDRQHRLRTLARRLIARGRMTVGARLMARWIDQMMAAELPESDEALADIRDHGMALWQHGDLPHASQALRAVVVLLNHRRDKCRDPVALRRALADWEYCIRASRTGGVVEPWG